MVLGDIGYKPEDVERNLEELFGLAHRWGCVLLLDEADVFLAKRSVIYLFFLQGMMVTERMLTSNRKIIWSATLLSLVCLPSLWWVVF